MKKTLLSGLVLLAVSLAHAPAFAQDETTTESTTSTETSSSGETVNYTESSRIIGKEVRSTDGEEVGTIDDLVLDSDSGCMAYTVLTTLDKKTVAVPWSMYQLSDQQDYYIVQMDRQRIYDAPAFDYNEYYSNPQYLQQVYAYYGIGSSQTSEVTQAESSESPQVSIDFFYKNLEGGSWIDVDSYGYCWQPNVATSNSDWRPYTDGKWAYTDVGWTWVSNEDFGWATYHYGRWADISDHGWVWLPGEEWGPAWVSWRTSDKYVGWAPLPPASEHTVYQQGSSISGGVDTQFDIGPLSYNFVDVQYIGEPVLRGRIYSPQRNVSIIDSTVNVTNISYSNSSVYNYGPDYATLSRSSARPIERLTIQREGNVDPSLALRRGTFTKVQGDRLIVNAPRTFKRADKQAAPQQVKAKVAKTKIQHGWNGIKDESVKTKLRQKMATGNKVSAPPRTVGPARAEPRPGAPARMGQRPGRPQPAQVSRGSRAPRRGVPANAVRRPNAPAQADRRPNAPANADRANADRHPNPPANADRPNADRHPNPPANADRPNADRHPNPPANADRPNADRHPNPPANADRPNADRHPNPRANADRPNASEKADRRAEAPARADRPEAPANADRPQKKQQANQQKKNDKKGDKKKGRKPGEEDEQPQ